MATKALSLAFDLLENAKGELKLYQLEQREVRLRLACEKGWGAIAQALMHAVDRPIRSHSEFLTVAQSLSRRIGRYEILAAERSGHGLHSAGFYRGELGIGQVRAALRDIEDALNVIRKKFS